MTQYLPGTHTISTFIQGTHPALTQRMAQATQAQTIATSAICRAEVRYGQGLMAADDKRRVPLYLLCRSCPPCPGPWPQQRYGEIQAQLKRQGLPIGDMDALIAALALAENLILVTDNTRHFERVVRLRVEALAERISHLGLRFAIMIGLVVVNFLESKFDLDAEPIRSPRDKLNTSKKFNRKIAMTLQSTKTHLIQLLEDKENKVVALSGKWGTGKSHLWRAVRDSSQDNTVKKALYVSLFGLGDMTQVKLKIIQSALPNAEAHPAAWDKAREGFKGVQKVLHSLHSGFSALDNLALLAVPTILKEKVIVLDDIERKHEKLSVDEVLGFIDEFTQLHKARFVLILNSDQLNDKTVWDRLREKVIDQEIRLDTTASEAFEIATSLTPSNFGVHIQKTVETCGVTNIRIIRKVINAVNRILGERQQLSEQILNRVIPSIVLLAAIHYKGIEDGPDFEFVLKTGSTEDWRDWGNQKEDLDEGGKRRAKWKLFLHQLGIIESDEFELLVVEYLQSGLFDIAAVSKIIDRYAAEASTMRAQEMARQLHLHVVWHHNLTESELLTEARALAKEVHLLDAYNVTSLHDLVSDLSGGQAVADLLLNNWTTAFNAQPGKDYDSENFFSRKLHPLIKKKFDAIKATVQAETTIFEACEQIVQNNGWGQRQEMVLRAATVKDFEEAIKSLDADKLRLFMCKFLELCVHHENHVSHFGTAMKHFIEACKNIYSDPNTGRLPQLIQILFKDAKLLPQLDPKLVKATPAPAVEATT